MRRARANPLRSILALFAFLLAVIAFLLAVIACPAARADAADPLLPESGDDLTVSLLTFGPGDHPFTKFGHNGLLVENRVLGTRVVYNYGTFSFDSIGLIPKFLLGKYRYWLSKQSLGRTLATYEAENRSVTLQKLRFTGDQKRELQSFLEWNALDENKYYVFDYYRDNCATRIRDLIDRSTAGALARASTGGAEMTWRQHTERLSAEDLPVFLGLYVAMGNVIDRPITEWEEMFLPAKLAEGVARGGLVEEQQLVVGAHRAAARARPPSWMSGALALGAIGALALAALGYFAGRGGRAARVGLGIGLASFGGSVGSLGCFFLFLWLFTNHEVAHHNENILACAPFAVLLVGAGYGVARGRPGALARAARLCQAGLALAAIGALLKVLPWFSQDNGLVLAFLLPVWAGAMGSVYLAAGTRASLRPTSREGSNDRKSSRGSVAAGTPGGASSSASTSAATTARGDSPPSR